LLPNPSAPLKIKVSGREQRTSWVPKRQRKGSGPEPKNRGGGRSGDATLCRRKWARCRYFDIPAPIPKFPPAHQQTLPIAGIDLDPLYGKICRGRTMVIRDRIRHRLRTDRQWWRMGTENGSALARDLARALDQTGRQHRRRPKGIGGNKEERR